ncbi:MAG: acyltransferase family protein [Enterocloster asparagiformis]|nr:acyltransferase family protein [Enterocloster asparagiformis]
MAVTRDTRVDNAKGGLITLVVMGHFLLPIAKTRFTTDCLYLIYSFHMPCFVFLSGYLAKGMYRGKGTYRWDRLGRLVWLYILFKLAVHVTEGLLNGKIGWKIDFFHESGAPWYLLALIIWHLMIPVLGGAWGKRHQYGMMAAVVLVSLAGGYAGRLEDFLAIDRVLAFAPFFCAGYYFPREAADRLFGGKYRRLRVALAAAVGLVIFFSAYGYLVPYRHAMYGSMYYRMGERLYPYGWLFRLAFFGITSVLSLGYLALAPARRVPVLTAMGMRTLPVYVLHRLVRDLCQYFGLYRFIDNEAVLPVIGLLAASAALAVILSCAPVSRVFERAADLPERLYRRYARAA